MGLPVARVTAVDIQTWVWFLESRCLQAKFTGQNLQAEMRAVLGHERHLIARHVFLWKNGADRAGRDARAAVDALVRVNVELIVALVNALDWANFDAGGIFGADAGLRDDVCHVDHLFLKLVWVFGKIWVLPIEQNHLNRQQLGCVEIVR